MAESVITGLTGPAGTGKSTAADVLSEPGCIMIDCDQTARQMFVDCEPCIRELRQEFGNDIVGGDGSVDRALLTRRAFSSHGKTHRLNEITHPWILRWVQKEIDEWKTAGKEFIIVDVPLLFENRAEKLCDKILAVITPPPVRLERITRRDNIDHEMALSRIRAQQKDAYCAERSDICLRGDGDPGELRRQTAALLERWHR